MGHFAENEVILHNVQKIEITSKCDTSVAQFPPPPPLTILIRMIPINLGHKGGF